MAAPIMAKLSGFRIWILALLGYGVLTVLLFRGLIGQFSTAVPHDLGDPLLSTWILWWNAHRVPFVGSWWDGLSFYPGHGSLALSDHRVGLALAASPIQWLGGSPVLAYNVVLLSSFALSALAAHGLTWLLTRSHAAGAVSGLIFGFNPFRTSHVAHLELLVVFWLPLAFAALHLYVRRYEARWLLIYAICWFLQGLSSGYYLFYSAPLIALWAFWFARERPIAGVGAIAGASLAVFAALLPVFLGYRAIHDSLFLTRSAAEIEAFSADLTGILSATPGMALWRVRSLAANGEAEIYLGIVAPLLVAAGMLMRRRRPSDRTPWSRLRLGVAAVGVAYLLIAAGTLWGPWRISIGPLTLSARQTVQPFSIAVLAFIIVGLMSATFVDAFRRRSAFAFYATAAVMTWGFTLGPRPTFLGEQLLYRGPYALLMLLPGFDERLRVPARFVMMTILAVAVAAGIALVRLIEARAQAGQHSVRHGRARLATALILAAIAADSWTFALPMPSVPNLVQLPAAVPPSAAVLELPLGNVGPDIAAVYRSIGHGRRVVNGYSGYDPPHYRVLRPALGERDGSILTALRRAEPLAVIVWKADDPGGGWSAFVEEQAGTIRLEETATHTTYLLPLGDADSSPDARGSPDARSARLPVRSGTFNRGLLDSQAVTDDNDATVWATPGPQRGGEEIVLELEQTGAVTGVSLSTGAALEGYPRRLTVSTSADGERWDDAWSGAMGGPTLDAVLSDPRAGEARIRFEARPARFIRLRQLGSHPDFGWFIGDLKVYGLPAP
jgi:hypothetical protein